MNPPVLPLAERSTRPPKLPAGPLVGTWWNSNSDTPSIRRVEIEEDAGALAVRVFAAAPGEGVDWRAVKAVVYASNIRGGEASAFEARFAVEGGEVLVVANHNRGVLVIHAFHRFPDSDSRASHMHKEFFHR